MKLCATCHQCYEDSQETCAWTGHLALIPVFAGSRLIGEKYRLDRLIARGGMGTVYAATQLNCQRTVAIKVLLPELLDHSFALERFRREARTAARVRHPAVAEIHDFGMLPSGIAYIVMEYVKGSTLRQRLCDVGQL